jgi:hypothetical protein
MNKWFRKHKKALAMFVAILIAAIMVLAPLIGIFAGGF